jgi:hypothetical protein
MLGVLGRLRAPWWATLSLAAVAVFLLPVTLLVDATLLFARVVRVGGYLERTEVVCPRGHVVRVSDRTALWQCSCGYGYLGSGFAPCPRCRSVAAFVQCSCGASVQNPVFDILGDRDAG